MILTHKTVVSCKIKHLEKKQLTDKNDTSCDTRANHHERILHAFHHLSGVCYSLLPPVNSRGGRIESIFWYSWLLYRITTIDTHVYTSLYHAYYMYIWLKIKINIIEKY